MTVLFAATLCLSAFLLFAVQPMVAKMVLPLLGGSPAVWNTCMVFFQVTLLLGYLYSHLTVKWLGVRRQAVLHLVIVLLPLLILPLGLPRGWQPRAMGNPIPWLLTVLAYALGLPFFALATNGPLLQRWFAETPHRYARDPFFLYAASNLGSLVALISYPLVLEPHLRLQTQAWGWSVAYVLLVAAIVLCGTTVWRTPRSGVIVAPDNPSGTAGSARPAITDQLRWAGLAFIPSSLMLGVTMYISTDVAAVPLLWVVPLALYLLTFVIVFARRPVLNHTSIARVLPFALLFPLFTLVAPRFGPMWVTVAMHLTCFFFVAMVAHGELVRTRPAASHLTTFYLWLSIGGALGGVFNALVAPLVFTQTTEYPLVLALAGLFRWQRAPDRPFAGRRGADFVVAWLLGCFALVAALGWNRLGPEVSTLVRALVVFGVPLVTATLLRLRPPAFALALALVLAAGWWRPADRGHVLHAERTYFGQLRVVERERSHLLLHGTTTHGAQGTDPNLRCEPLTYYHRTGPAGQLFTSFVGEHFRFHIGVVGLGTGSLAGYAEPGQRWTFFEIDPAVERIARDPRLFTYLRDCAPNAQVVLGDARLSLARASDGAFDVLVFDAFSSDAIPVHLLTREALALYLRKLAPRGVLAFHISNRYLDLRPALGRLAADAGLIAMAQEDERMSLREAVRGKSASAWVVLARSVKDLGDLVADARWRQVAAAPGRVWTDDYSDLVSALRRR